MKIGRIFFGKGQGPDKKWETILTVFGGKYPNRFDVAFSRKAAKGEGYAKGTAIRYDDEQVLLIGDVFPKLALDDEFAIFRIDADGNPVARLNGEEEIAVGGTPAAAADDFEESANSDDIPF